MNSKEIIEKLLRQADVKINGDRPWDIKVLDERFYDRVLSQGTLGLGESYMDSWWECEKLDEMICRVLRVGGENLVSKNLLIILHVIKAKIFNLQTKKGAKKVTLEHYDIGDDLYMAFLDPYSQYTCAYFKDTDDLNKAQENKMDLICRKIQLKSTDRVLDIGCGWGGFARWMAEKYKCSVVGINLAKGQVEYAKKHISTPLVEIRNMDYRDVPKLVSGKFDKVVSIGMMEHVGYKNHRTFMKVVREMIKPDGLFLLHHCARDTSSSTAEPWIEKYIFPGAVTPSPLQLTKSFEGIFVLEDWHNMGAHYDPTLMAWYKNFEKSWPKFKNEYGHRFFRMFRYYLLAFAGAFRARDMHLYQTVFSPNGVIGGYESVR